MATLASAPVRQAAEAVVNQSGFATAVLSGIVPDRAHLSSGGYHCSVEDLRKHGNGRDYSNTRADDRDFNIKYGAAYDVSMSRADMIKCYQRVRRVWLDHSDPRRKYINCVNVWDGSGDAVRLDFVTGKSGYANSTHTWHIHGEFRRRYVLDPKAARAHASMYRGESKAAWNAREETGKPATVVTPPKPVATTVTRHAPGSRILQYTPGKAVLTGEDVTYVQKFIGTARAGTPDGRFGARTRSAVIWYQGMRGLKADGIVGAATWRALGVKTKL